MDGVRTGFRKHTSRYSTRLSLPAQLLAFPSSSSLAKRTDASGRSALATTNADEVVNFDYFTLRVPRYFARFAEIFTGLKGNRSLVEKYKIA
mgnify:CR=1 FL=1